VAIAAAQISGIDFGMVSSHMHGAMSGEHLMHESTAWLLALGLAMIAPGVWPVAAIGVAAITGVYSVALLSYVVVDAFDGDVTPARISSHVPVLLGLVFALLVARERAGSRRPRSSDADADLDLPARPNGRRRGHLWPINRSAPDPIAASTTTGRRLTTPAQRRWLAMTASSDDQAVTALALAAARGNERALEAFIKATQRDVWRFVTYLSDASTADDLTQETFLRAIGAIERFSGRSSARTWLLAIARRVVADHIRHAQSRPRTASATDPDHVLSGNRNARGFEDLVEVTTMIAGLTTEQREALLLTQLLGLPYADAAAVCGCPVGTIRSRVARARDALLASPPSPPECPPRQRHPAWPGSCRRRCSW
jgi:RNA polymerase sigma-70 factor (ECF subfamily)